jgi:hypothetical protein
MKVNALRWCFVLLAVVLISQVVVTMAGSFTCYYLFIVGKTEVGNCAGFGTMSREIWSEALAAILALLLAARNDNDTK